MGLFTKEEKVDYTIPLSLRMKADTDKTQRQFTDMYLDPAIKENIGYESPRMKMKTLTQGVDLTDGKKVQETFLALQAIDPQQATGWLESIKPVIAQQLDSLKIKDARLKSDILANKGSVNAMWTGLAKPQYISAKTKELFEIHGVEGPGVPTMELFRSRLKDLGLEKADRNRVYQDLAKALKAEEKDWKVKNQTRDFNVSVESKNDSSESNEFDDPATNTESITSQVFGSASTKGVTQVDPESSQFMQSLQKDRAGIDIRTRLSRVYNKLRQSIVPNSPEFALNDKQLEAENKKDTVADWLSTSEASNYFKTKAGLKELAKFEKNPVLWYFTAGKGKADKTDYSEYNLFGN